MNLWQLFALPYLVMVGWTIIFDWLRGLFRNMNIEQGNRVRLISDVSDDAGGLHRAGEKADVVGFLGLTHAIVVFGDREYALAPLEALVKDDYRRRSK